MAGRRRQRLQHASTRSRKASSSLEVNRIEPKTTAPQVFGDVIIAP